MGERILEINKLIVGLDIGNDYSQITCFNYNILEPESIGEEKEEYQIPTVLGVTHDTKDWIYGRDAIRQEQLGKAYLLKNFIDQINNQNEIIIHEVSFSADGILEKYIKKCLLEIKKIYPNKNIDQIYVSVKKPSLVLVQMIYGGLERLGIHKDRCRVLNHEMSFVYYTIYQKKEIWRNDVGLFNFNRKGMFYSHLTMNRRRTPILVETIEEDYTNMLDYEMIQELEKEEINQGLYQVVKVALHKKIVSTLYLTGIGFMGDWFDDTVVRLCDNRKVYKGQNIYAAGACYAAREYADNMNQGEYLILCEGISCWDIMFNVYSDADMRNVYLGKAGTPWYESSNVINVILDNILEIPIVIRNIIDGEESVHNISLEGVKNYSDRIMKVSIEGCFIEARIYVITIRDIGFGEIQPSTNRIWEKVIELQ